MHEDDDRDCVECDRLARRVEALEAEVVRLREWGRRVSARFWRAVELARAFRLEAALARKEAAR